MTFAPPVITVDVEDWVQSTWDRERPVGPRAADNARKMLELLARADVRGTMFVLGKFADAHPAVVKEIHAAGHEIACHGHGHVEIFKQARADLIEDVRRAKDTLEQLIGAPVRGYRAPDFSIVRRTLWALEVLVDLGFQYDSSIFPVRRPRYGIPEWPVTPVRVCLADGRALMEFPIGTLQAWGRNWPVGGGGYHRLLPGALARHFVRRAMTQGPFVFYCHPYELDQREMRDVAPFVPLAIRFHQGLGRGRFLRRLEAFLAEFGGQRMDALLATVQMQDLHLAQFTTFGASDRSS